MHGNGASKAWLGLLLLAAGTLADAAPGAGRRVVDDDGRTVELPARVDRIVSLSPGATAMLFAAGAGDRIVGTSEYSEEPAAARTIERVGDSQRVDVERLLALKPDVIVVWSAGMSASRIDTLARLGLPIYRHHITRLDELPAVVQRFGELAGTGAAAEPAASALGRRIAALRARYAGEKRGTVLLQVWGQPLYTLGRRQLLSDAIGACGYRNVFDDLLDAGSAVGLEAVLARDPDMILAIGEPRVTDEWLARWRGFPDLHAVRDRRLLAITDRRLTQLGPEVLDAVEALCRRLDAP